MKSRSLNKVYTETPRNYFSILDKISYRAFGFWGKIYSNILFGFQIVRILWHSDYECNAVFKNTQNTAYHTRNCSIINDSLLVVSIRICILENAMTYQTKWIMFILAGKILISEGIMQSNSIMQRNELHNAIHDAVEYF